MNIITKNRKAKFNYEIIEKYSAGIQLFGSEIKSIRENKTSINEGYCFISDKNEVFIKNMYIKEYTFSSYLNHEENRDRKLLLNKKEIKQLRKGIEQKGMTIVPLTLLINKAGLCKLEIALAKGKNTYDKKNVIKNRDIKKETDRILKKYK